MPNLIDSVHHVVVITGAGFSSPSGLPVYRDSGTGWIDAEVEKLSHASAYGNHLEQLWPHWHSLARVAADAEPNAAHLALARWEQLLAAREKPGSLAIVTQNVDGLHQRAGSAGVIEAHGSILAARTLKKNSSLFDYEPEPGAGPPPAPDGDLRTRPDIVLFGEQPRGMRRAVQLIKRADLVLFAGTSGRVWPVAGLLDVANDSGAHTMLLNQQEWDAGHFDVIVLDDVVSLDDLVPQL